MHQLTANLYVSFYTSLSFIILFFFKYTNYFLKKTKIKHEIDLKMFPLNKIVKIYVLMESKSIKTSVYENNSKNFCSGSYSLRYSKR